MSESSNQSLDGFIAAVHSDTHRLLTQLGYTTGRNLEYLHQLGKLEQTTTDQELHNADLRARLRTRDQEILSLRGLASFLLDTSLTWHTAGKPEQANYYIACWPGEVPQLAYFTSKDFAEHEWSKLRVLDSERNQLFWSGEPPLVWAELPKEWVRYDEYIDHFKRQILQTSNLLPRLCELLDSPPAEPEQVVQAVVEHVKHLRHLLEVYGNLLAEDPFAPDWEQVDPADDWHTFDADGCGASWTNCPVPYDEEGQATAIWQFSAAFAQDHTRSTDAIDMTGLDWRNSLRHRPQEEGGEDATYADATHGGSSGEDAQLP